MKCRHIKNDNSQCNAFAIKGKQFCFMHDPESKGRHLEATKKGGKGSGSKPKKLLPKIAFGNPCSVIEILQDAISRVRVVDRDGIMDVKVANCIGFLCNKLLEAEREINLASRIDRIEELIERSSDGPDR